MRLELGSNVVTRQKRHINEPEKGYILLEVVVVGILVIAIATSFSLYARADGLRAGDAARSTAFFLARAEIAEIEEMVATGKLMSDSFGYLGYDSDLRQNGIEFKVLSEIKPIKDGLYEAIVTVSWNIAEREERNGSATLARVIRH